MMRWSCSTSEMVSSRSSYPIILSTHSSMSADGDLRSGPSVPNSGCRRGSKSRYVSTLEELKHAATHSSTSTTTCALSCGFFHTSPCRYKCHPPSKRSCVSKTIPSSQTISMLLLWLRTSSMVLPTSGKGPAERGAFIRINSLPMSAVRNATALRYRALSDMTKHYSPPSLE